MRLTDTQIQAIRQFSRQVAGERSRVRVFGSRLDDAAHGGDLDLMLELTVMASLQPLIMKLAMTVSPYPTFPRKREKGQTNRYASFTLTESVGNPALMAAQMSGLVSRAMNGRKVDVLPSAPNLMRLPIHEIAFQEGQLL